MQKYLKSLVPLVAGVALFIIDKAFAGDAVPDEVWLALMGTAPVVWAVPNKTDPIPVVVAVDSVELKKAK